MEDTEPDFIEAVASSGDLRDFGPIGYQGTLISSETNEESQYSPSCLDPLQTADGLIGLSGLYNVDLVSDLASSLFGADRDEAAAVWDEGNPIVQAHRRPELPVLLLHGSSDQLVPLSFTTQFADALEEGGHPLTLNVVANADHHSIYSPEVAGDLLLEWITNVADG